jgi:hypothetical protein
MRIIVTSLYVDDQAKAPNFYTGVSDRRWSFVAGRSQDTDFGQRPMTNDQRPTDHFRAQW